MAVGRTLIEPIEDPDPPRGRGRGERLAGARRPPTGASPPRTSSPSPRRPAGPSPASRSRSTWPEAEDGVDVTAVYRAAGRPDPQRRVHHPRHRAHRRTRRRADPPALTHPRPRHHRGLRRTGLRRPDHRLTPPRSHHHAPHPRHPRSASPCWAPPAARTNPSGRPAGPPASSTPWRSPARTARSRPSPSTSPSRSRRPPRRVLTEGDGAEIEANSVVTFDFLFVNGRDGTVISSSYDTEPVELVYEESLMKGVYTGLDGVTRRQRGARRDRARRRRRRRRDDGPEGHRHRPLLRRHPRGPGDARPRRGRGRAARRRACPPWSSTRTAPPPSPCRRASRPPSCVVQPLIEGTGPGRDGPDDHRPLHRRALEGRHRVRLVVGDAARRPPSRSAPAP